jgi:lysophospholipase L1-like esterase
MPKYVNHQPPLAGKDYTHFTRAGADHIAEMLLAYLKGN